MAGGASRAVSTTNPAPTGAMDLGHSTWYPNRVAPRAAAASPAATPVTRPPADPGHRSWYPKTAGTEMVAVRFSPPTLPVRTSPESVPGTSSVGEDVHATAPAPRHPRFRLPEILGLMAAVAVLGYFGVNYAFASFRDGSASISASPTAEPPAPAPLASGTVR